MQFNPKIHTREYLLQHLSIAVELTKTSPSYIKGLAQDESYIIAAHHAAKTAELGLDVHPSRALCDSKFWINSPAAQNKKILALTFNAGLSFAHLLSEKPDWACSPAAQDHDVLRLTRPNGYSVGHALAKRSEWGLTPAAQDMTILDGLRTKATGDAVVHYLAYYNDSWLSTDAAKDRAVLGITSSRDSISVLQYAFQATNQDEATTAANILLRPLKFGDAVFIRSSDGLTVNIIREFMSGALVRIENSIDPAVNSQLVAALYSSLVNLKSSYGASKLDLLVVSELEAAIEYARSMVLTNLGEVDADYSRLLSGYGTHCDPARDLVLKEMNNAVLSGVTVDVTQEKNNELHPENDNQTLSLY